MEPQEIIQLREQLGWSLASFGKYFGVTAQAVLKWERGTAKPNDFVMAAMIQLEKRLDHAESEKQKQQLKNGLRRALLTGGILALLAFLFNKEEE
ncbi:MAG: hypothetical protein CL670_07265 [Balneola sp.]|jgi:transcriptional regulator with XRE-family HTH domain|nr:hypothetical protein [Balneola sp.]MBE78934.1 hypothetical protein [Balneola sp.]|tara:strand:- start:2724 stop:3008 length:285 start_codon:yes stop_codon:yes gene_type:complete